MTYVYLVCNCGSPDHGVLIQPDDDIDGAFTLSVTSTKTAGLWQRITQAFRHVVMSERLIRADVVLDRAEAERLVAYLKAPFAASDQSKSDQP